MNEEKLRVVLRDLVDAIDDVDRCRGTSTDMRNARRWFKDKLEAARKALLR